MRKITKRLRRAITTRRAMPQLWFDLMFIGNLAVPFALFTGNRGMLWLAAALELTIVIWYAVGWVPVRKPVRRVQSTATRTRRAPARRRAA